MPWRFCIQLSERYWTLSPRRSLRRGRATSAKVAAFQVEFEIGDLKAGALRVANSRRVGMMAA